MLRLQGMRQRSNANTSKYATVWVKVYTENSSFRSNGGGVDLAQEARTEWRFSYGAVDYLKARTVLHLEQHA